MAAEITQGSLVDLIVGIGGVTRFAVGDKTTWYRGGLEQRLSIGTRGAIHLRGTANRQDGDEWFEAGATASFYF